MAFEFEDNNYNGYKPSGRTKEPSELGFITRFFILIGLGSDQKTAQIFILGVAIVFFILAILIAFVL
jgi:hypothetical protein